MGIWAGLTFCLLAAGVISLAFSIVWRKPDILMNMVVSKADLTAGLILGIAFIISFFIAIAGVVQRNHVTIGLVITNYVLLVDAIGVLVIGTFIWFYTLTERADFNVLWLAATPQVRQELQDKFQCCGYFMPNQSFEISNFCANTTFVNQLNPNVSSNACVTPITAFADYTLNNIFSSIYGFMAIVLCLLLATLCVIKKRQEDERFKKIDAKRGGKGFVKRKVPISKVATASTTSSKPQASRNVIRRFHILIKSKAQLENKQMLSAQDVEELGRINAEIEEMGGLEWYQQMSAVGQGDDRGGGSEKIFVGWLKEMKIHEGRPDKLQLLEVGALKPENYRHSCSWIQNTPIDLRSRHPDIREQDFLLLDPIENQQKWDAISLSLVVNFVPDSKDRGRMLSLANTILKDSGYLFLTLPLPCVTNSRYMTFDHLNSLMEALGFIELRRRWKEGGKMAYWLYEKQHEPRLQDFEKFTKKIILRSGNRNNFNILLTR
ncbi:hypothetical protein NP233_g2849 [Leucocoprinus birnbaumii]|uniref:25S rRNA adenine-N(1) methyltransferase n=1 Tax=Leucocoprinus birnbaumii TaxID=56174 RepID=A0AAD5VY52_9AGAR|nr:hypothetical protein NP233_g2849 [Leucocoprinus birnbaumii]